MSKPSMASLSVLKKAALRRMEAPSLALDKASSSVKTSNFKKFRRIPITPRELWQSYGNGLKKIALVFGREGDGLSNEAISMSHLKVYFYKIAVFHFLTGTNKER